MDTTDLKLKFEFQLAKNVSEMKKIHSFKQLQRMLDEYGYFEGATKLIDGHGTSGLADLLMAGRADLSIEHLALSEEFQLLFNENQLKKCKQKLGF